MAKKHDRRQMTQIEVWHVGRRAFALFSCPECGTRKQYTYKRSQFGVYCEGNKQAANK